jgi:Putative abortive phage resistance protein AbiGi, antitoxin
MYQPYTADTLVHFVGRARPSDDEDNFRLLKLILNAGQVSYAPHTPDQNRAGYEVNLLKSLRTGDLLVPTVTCFADIPHSSLGIHTTKYGRFGIGFRRRFLMEQGARPVTYLPWFSDHARMHSVHSGPQLAEDVEAIYKGFRKYMDTRKSISTRTLRRVPETEQEVLAAAQAMVELHFLSYVKVFDADLSPDHPDSFYMEREWRKFGYLKFAPAQVACVWLEPSFHARFKAEAPRFTSVPILEL